MTRQEIDFFNKIAPEWDSMEVRSLPVRINHILDLMQIEPGMNVADLGTGTGVLIPYLLQRVGSHGRVTAVDGAPGMLEIARAKYGKSGDNLTFLLADFEENMPVDRYDRIILYCVYPHLRYPVETLRNLIDHHLRPGGYVYIAFPNDETFVNHIHGEKKSTADMLPSAPALALRLFDNGFNVRVVEYSEDAYIIRLN
ncbi:MAG: class I SAM-dependent methyltransferase [Muribaculaceae bacterium]|nr:class I SAM-dependent methyltransferase [Muribaculaceae bacterium]